jgi:benzoyl-CoA reductase/2-hydroxyglutaryl-CoA dehydratase subunit BcrC/BadD/HgdB
MAEPDLLLGSSATCDPRFKWYQALGRYKDTPIYNFDVVVPPVDAELTAVRDYYVRYQTEQLRGLVAFLERVLGRKLDYEQLWETIDIAERTNQLWFDTQELRKAVPCPMPTEDHFNTFAPGRFLLGEKEALDFYQELYDELKYRVEHKIGVVPQERYRLLWGGGLPPWHNMKLLNFFEDLGAVFVIETTYRPWDPVEIPAGISDPLEHIAWRAFLTQTYRHERARRGCGHPHVQLLLDLVEDYQVVGVVMHGTVSCRAQTIGQLYFGNVVQEYLSVPSMSLESDIIDARNYSEAQTRMQIEAFIQKVDAHRRG